VRLAYITFSTACVQQKTVRKLSFVQVYTTLPDRGFLTCYTHSKACSRVFDWHGELAPRVTMRAHGLPHASHDGRFVPLLAVREIQLKSRDTSFLTDGRREAGQQLFGEPVGGRQDCTAEPRRYPPFNFDVSSLEEGGGGRSLHLEGK